MKKLFLASLLFSFLLISCKKKDDISPYIQITYPYVNSTHNVFDTLVVIGSVSDNEHLDYVKISLIDENNITACSVVTLYPESEDYTLNHEFVIDNIFMASGNYNLLVTASDGVNETRKYIALSINEVAKELTGVLFVETPTTNSVTVNKVKPDLSVLQIASVDGDFSSSAISTKNQAFYMAGSETGSFRAIEMLNNSELWNIAATPLPGATFFSDVFEDDGSIYISYYDGIIKTFDKNGNLKQQIFENGYRCFKLFKTGNFLFSEQLQTGTTNRRMVVYNASSGVIIQTIPLDMEVVAFCKRNDDNVFVYGNNGTQGYMKDYVISTNSFWEPHPLPAEKVLSAERIDDNTFLLGLENGVSKYTYNPNSLTDYLPAVSASSLKYDALNNVVVLSQASSLRFYNYMNTSLVSTVTAASEIKSINLLYNK